MTAARAADSLHGTLRAANVPRPVILVGHSVAGLTTRLYVGEHPADVAGVVLFDPTVASFARMFDDKEFRPGWDGTASASQVEQVTTWPDIPFEVLLHDPAVYATQEIWSETVEAQLGRRRGRVRHARPEGRRPGCAGLWSQRVPRCPSCFGRCRPAGAGRRDHEAVTSSRGPDSHLMGANFSDRHSYVLGSHPYGGAGCGVVGARDATG